MAKVSISEAARLTGKSRVTIHRHIEKGTLSRERDGTGNPVLDLAELERVYGGLKQPDLSQHGTARQFVTSNQDGMLQAENQALRDRMADLEAERVREREQLTASISDLRTERDRLMKLVEDQTATVKLLTDQRPPTAPDTLTQPPEQPSASPKGLRAWLHRLTG